MNAPNRPRGRNGGRKPLPEGEKLQSITVQLRPVTIAKLRQWAGEDKARKHGKLINELLVEFFSELGETKMNLHQVIERMNGEVSVMTGKHAILKEWQDTTRYSDGGFDIEAIIESDGKIFAGHYQYVGDIVEVYQVGIKTEALL